MKRLLGISCVVAGLWAGMTQAAETVIDDKYLSEDGDGANWAAYGRNSSEQRYSPLTQINADNVKQLGVAWSLDLPNERSLLATPLAIDGVLYFTASYSRTRAVDAKTGKVLWEYDPKVIAEIATAGTVTSFVTSKADFIKLRELSVAYQLPRGIAKWFRAADGSVSLSARNLHTWTGYSGLDPESYFVTQQFVRLEQDQTPQLASFNISLNLTF